MVNVPTGVLVDEQGTIVRYDEGTYSRKYEAGNLSFGTDEYVPMVRDWVKNGSASRFVRAPRELAAQLGKASSAEAKADAAFRLGSFFELGGDRERAEQYWEQAQALNPDSWNYHRQDWSYAPAEAGAKWFEKFQTLEGKPYYAPMATPDSPDSSGKPRR